MNINKCLYTKEHIFSRSYLIKINFIYIYLYVCIYLYKFNKNKNIGYKHKHNLNLNNDTIKVHNLREANHMVNNAVFNQHYYCKQLGKTLHTEFIVFACVLA